ncbi:molybdate ABC transporter substrate-binding protein [Paraliobacillus sp. X-1268]|uniref:molybdate ABC transporter substrate-binding protein n=1 Tax=Paraliobacillus sp. X-1268 TaxID=2213193 RepID=UPI000E3DB304|nr:molybdate ABC transporter substrate-binding protein [Paraliobacillus sp. X-1268]
MQKKQILCLLIGSLLILTTACVQNSKGSNEEKVELTISAAASLTDVMDELVTVFEEDHTNIQIQLNLGSSGALQQQIEQGAPTDLFISAAEDKLIYLLEKNLIDDRYYQTIVENSLVLIANKEANSTITSFEDLLETDVKKIAIGTPESVPAGAYAKQTLEQLGLYQTLSEKDKLIPAKDVRQVLQYVETNNVDAGIVYQTDAIQSDLVEIVAVADQADHDRIAYPAGVVKDTNHEPEAILFYDFLTSEQATTIFKEYGFRSVGSEND